MLRSWKRNGRRLKGRICLRLSLLYKYVEQIPHQFDPVQVLMLIHFSIGISSQLLFFSKRASTGGNFFSSFPPVFCSLSSFSFFRRASIRNRLSSITFFVFFLKNLFIAEFFPRASFLSPCSTYH